MANNDANFSWLSGFCQRNFGKSLNVDTSKVIIGGGSAGGILGCNLCFNNKLSDDFEKKIAEFLFELVR